MIRVSVQQTDVWEYNADVLALETAQAVLGRDPLSQRLAKVGIELREAIGKTDAILLPSNDAVQARQLLLINMGYDEIVRSGYTPIREFGRKVLVNLHQRAPDTHHLALLPQGIWQGLDEIEAFESVLAGFLDAVTLQNIPMNLEHIDFCDKNQGRALRLGIALRRLFPDGILPIPGRTDLSSWGTTTFSNLNAAGYASTTKPHVFVAMPFTDEMDDVFHYGIQNAVHAAGFICERADFSSFTGEAMAWVRQRINTAALVIAEVTQRNVNVYLEVGYSWGRDRPTVLLAREKSELPFDVRGHRCLFYRRIKDLEAALKTELASLKQTP